ncbi:hypothetical protein FC14_GL000100 [Ligilactobacillus agilis DSM 20509]|uniref:WxL domain-containing protein n=1 Tax=Ligilactobacillus agilis DSM 20509 TaxID=1423718 RepID=A0A0R2AB93_9LACO|nr:hypothetical protein [Ligilactobacillus agilis]KRM63978.1 hypothetical protein FC14_GL000100 [Ligilactobacillus agilis DSM 20509]
MKNKVITGLLGFLVVLGMATPALADQVGASKDFNVNEQSTVNDKDGTVEVTSNVHSNFTLQIPSSFELGYNHLDAYIGDVSIKNDPQNGGYGITAGKVVNVTEKHQALQNDSDKNNKIEFTVSGSEDKKDNSFGTQTFTNQDMFNNRQVPVFMHVTQDQWNQAKAGNYTGSITFTATLADAQ